MARFSDIPQFTRSAGYMVHVGLDHLARHYARMVTHYGLDVSPDFQRGYVWTQEQKIRFMEYMLRGGTSGLDIYCNAPTWQHGSLTPHDPNAWFVLIDGKQRIDAALGFLNNEFPVFGQHYLRDFTDRLRMVGSNFRWHVNDLKTREECLKWYLDLNSGGTVHTEDELNKVRLLLEKKTSPIRPSFDAIKNHAGIHRQIFTDILREDAEEDERLRIQRENATKYPSAKKPHAKKSR